MSNPVSSLPPKAKLQLLIHSFKGLSVIHLIMAVIASACMVVSIIWIKHPIIKWTIGTTVVLLLAVACALYIKHRRMITIRTYHSAVVESLMQSEAVPISVLNREGYVIELNEASSQTFGYERSALLGKPFSRLVEPSARAVLKEMLIQVSNGHMQKTNINIIHRSGFPLELQLVCTPMTQNNEVIGSVLISHDLSDRKRNVERIRYMAYYDDMTGLPNRTLFLIKLEEQLEWSRSNKQLIGVCYIDIDGFKLVNASFGRDNGDMLLMQIAERLNREQSEDIYVARMDSDEFAVFIANLESEEQLTLWAQRLIESIEEPFDLSGFPLHITASVGLVTSQAAEDDTHKLINKAEVALEKLKLTSKNDSLFYSDSWNNSSLEKLTLQHELYQAIQKNEFILHYQPQYDLESGKIIGVEALVRWIHPHKGMLAPGKFIPLAEESGMIVQIGDWVLEEAIRQNKAWQDAGFPPIHVSVNLSMRQIVQHDFVSKIAYTLEKIGLEAKYLDIEITESMTMDTSHITRFLKGLTDLGVNISVDDFGTGYSSFHYLKNFQIDRLKIDRSFVRDIQQDKSAAEIIAAIIAMAHNLNLQVIAEGVENEEQLAFLQEKNCDEMQGYLRSPPVHSNEIEQLFSVI